jgi:hypothetical protein
LRKERVAAKIASLMAWSLQSPGLASL